MAIVSTGLLAEFRCDEGSGNTTADSSGNGNTGKFGLGVTGVYGDAAGGTNLPTWGSGGITFGGNAILRVPIELNAAKTVQFAIKHTQRSNANAKSQALIGIDNLSIAYVIDHNSLPTYNGSSNPTIGSSQRCGDGYIILTFVNSNPGKIYGMS